MRVIVLLLALSGTAFGEGTVIARATAERGGSWTPCGGVHAVGWVVYELESVVSGTSPGDRFVAIHSCPDGHLRGTLRLDLSTKKPAHQPDLSEAPPKDLPRFYATSAKPESAPETKDAGTWLRRARKDVTLTSTGTDGEWVVYGDLALRFDQDVVVALRANVALGLTCTEAAEHLGFIAGKGKGFPLRKKTSCEWPGTSDKHRLAKGLAGRLKDGVFDIWVK